MNYARNIALVFTLFLPFKLVSQMTNPGPGQGTVPPQEIVSLQQLLQSPNPVMWVFTGDSITQGAHWTGLERPYPSLFAERVRWELKRPRDLVVNTAISGNVTQDLLSDFDWRVAHLKPTVVIMMFGMNDCAAGKTGESTFHDNLSEIVRKVRRIGAIPILETTNTTMLDTKRTPKS